MQNRQVYFLAKVQRVKGKSHRNCIGPCTTVSSMAIPGSKDTRFTHATNVDSKASPAGSGLTCLTGLLCNGRMNVRQVKQRRPLKTGDENAVGFPQHLNIVSEAADVYMPRLTEISHLTLSVPHYLSEV